MVDLGCLPGQEEEASMLSGEPALTLSRRNSMEDQVQQENDVTIEASEGSAVSSAVGWLRGPLDGHHNLSCDKFCKSEQMTQNHNCGHTLGGPVVLHCSGRWKFWRPFFGTWFSGFHSRIERCVVPNCSVLNVVSILCSVQWEFCAPTQCVCILWI